MKTKAWITLIYILLPLVFILNGPDAKSQNPAIGTNIGNIAPEIVMQDVNGKTLKLSSLKGKVVLIDFWASWCGPCRRENPNVVEAFNKYKDRKFKDAKGLEIFSVSLDKNKDAWIKAIKDDRLDWPNHVSDLQYWQNAAAKTYGVNSIPTNFLIDAKGIIVAKNLRGIDLQYQIEKLTKN